MSDGAKLHGQQYEPGKDRTYRFVQQSKDYTGTDAARVTGDEGTPGVDINPTDRAAALTRTYNLEAIVEMLESEVLSVPTLTTVRDLPDVLNSVTVTYNSSSGDGQSSYPASQQNFGFAGTGSGGFSPKATAQASAAVLPNVSWDISSYKDWVVSGMIHTFNIASSSVTMAQVLARLTTISGAAVLALPKFKTKSHRMTLNGGQTSVQASASSTATVAASDSSGSFSTEYGNGYSKEVGVSVRTETIPETLHAVINIGSSALAVSATVDVRADTKAISGVVSLPPIVNDPPPVSGTAYASVSPTTLPATTPSDIPRTGLYLVELAGQRDDFGVAQFRALVVDFAQYA